MYERNYFEELLVEIQTLKAILVKTQKEVRRI